MAPHEDMLIAIIGQSNANGNGTTPPTSTSAASYWRRIVEHESPRTWGPVTVDETGHHGIEFALANELGDDLRILKIVQGSTPCTYWSSTGIGGRAVANETQMALEGIAVRSSHLVWMQGESDAAAGGSSDEYLECLHGVLDHFANVFPDMHPWIVELPFGIDSPIRDTQKMQPGFVSSDGAEVKGIHYTSAGLNLLGERVARRIRSE